MGERIKICNINDLKNNTIKKFTVKETEILIAKTGSNFYAFVFTPCVRSSEESGKPRTDQASSPAL